MSNYIKTRVFGIFVTNYMFSQSQWKMAFIAVRHNHSDVVKLVAWLSCVNHFSLLSVILRWFPFDACCTTDVISTTTVVFFSHFSNYSLDELRVVFIIMFFWELFIAHFAYAFGRQSYECVCFVYILYPVCIAQILRVFPLIDGTVIVDYCSYFVFFFFFLF